MPNPKTFLNRPVLKPETIRAIEALGEQASQIADRWASGWPKQTRKLESENRLLEALSRQVEAEALARQYEAENPWVGGIEANQLFDIDPAPPA